MLCGKCHSPAIAQERRREFSAKSRLDGFGQEIEHIAFFHSKRGDHGENALDKSAAILAISAETALSPKNPGTDPSFSSVVCRFNAGNTYEGEERGLEFENLAALGRDFWRRGLDSAMQETDYLASDGAHVLAEARPQEGSVANPMPVIKHQVALCL